MSGRSVGDELTPNPSQHKSLRVIAQVTPCRVSAITLYISRTHPCLTTPEPYISITPLLKSIRRDGFILVFNKQYNKCYCFENFSHECISRGIQKSLIIPSDGQQATPILKKNSNTLGTFVIRVAEDDKKLTYYWQTLSFSIVGKRQPKNRSQI